MSFLPAGTLFARKVKRRDIPAGQAVTGFGRAADWNAILDALMEVQAAIVNGTYSTLKKAYAAAVATTDNEITLDATRGPVRVFDAFVTMGKLFEVVAGNLTTSLFRVGADFVRIYSDGAQTDWHSSAMWMSCDIKSASDGAYDLYREGFKGNACHFTLYGCRQKDVTPSATPTFNPTQGDYQTMLVSANVTAWTISNGVEGQIIKIRFTQSGGGHTVAAPTNVRMESFTMTAADGKSDVLVAIWDVTLTDWVQLSFKQNLP